MGRVTVTVEYDDNGTNKKKTIQSAFDETVNQELFCQWYNEQHGGYKVEGVGGRPNDRK